MSETPASEAAEAVATEAVRWTPRRLPGLVTNVRQLLAAMWVQSRHLDLPQAASSLTLLTLMAVVPMAAVGLLVLTALPAFESMRSDVERFLATNLFLPSFSGTVMRMINQFAAKAGELSAIGTVIFLATALAAMLTIDRTLNRIWRTPRPRPLAQRLGLYWTLLTLGPVLLGLTLAGHLRVAALLAHGGWPSATLASVLPALFATALLTLLYRLAPNERVRWAHALLGALAAALLIEGLKRLFGMYVARFPAHTMVYGAFAALPLFLLWVFAIWMSVLAGALLAASLRFWGVALGDPRRPTPATEFDRLARVVVAVLRSAPERVPSLRFRADFGGDALIADHVAALLAEQGYLVRVWPVRPTGGTAGVWDEAWLAAPGLAEMTLRPLFDLAWSGQSCPPRGGRVAAATPFDPGNPLLSRPLREVAGSSLASADG